MVTEASEAAELRDLSDLRGTGCSGVLNQVRSNAT